MRSAFSALVSPGIKPRSMRSWRRRLLDRLLADSQIPGHIGDRPPGLEQIKNLNLPSELRRSDSAIPGTHHSVLPG